MLKIEEKEIPHLQHNNLRICLSPFCFNSQNRIFLIEDKQNFGVYCHNKEQCSKWVTSLTELSQPLTSYKPKQFNNLELNFNNQPIQALKKICRLEKSEWKKQLIKEINTIRKEVNAALETMEENLIKKAEDILSNKRFISEINELMDTFLCQSSSVKKQGNSKPTQTSHYNSAFLLDESHLLTAQLNKYLHKNAQPLSQLRSVHFLQKLQVKQQLQQIKSRVSQLQKHLLSQKTKVKARLQQRAQFYEWMFLPQQNMFNKLQLVGNLFNTRQQNYHISDQTIRLNCMLCQSYAIEKVTPQNIKQLKKHIAEQLNIHMYNQHHDKIFYAYLRKVLKSHCRQLTVTQLLAQLEPIQELHLVDRETGMSYTEDFVSSDILSLDILTKKNAHLAKNNYILIESKQAINSFVSILAYECSNQKRKLLVVSNRFQHLEEISKIFSFPNIATTKKYDGLERVKFEEDRKLSKVQASTVKKAA